MSKMMKIQEDIEIKEILMSILIPYEARAITYSGQSLERLNERGGISLHEAYAILKDVPYHEIKHVDIEFIRHWIKEQK